MSSKSASAQNSQILTVKDSLKVQEKASAFTRDFMDSLSLASLRDSKKLKSIVNETICFPPGKYYRGISSSTVRALIGPMFGVPSANEGTMDLVPGRTDNSTNYDEITMVVKKASSSKIIVVYHDEEYKIETRDSGLKYMMLLKDRDELLRQINQLYIEEEQEVIQERQNNLAAYRESINRFRNGSTGPIAISKGKREYDGTWSLGNLLYGYCRNTKYPQAVYEALEGEKVYVLKTDDYEEDEIVEISIDRDNKPKIETKKNGVVEIDRIVGVRWLEKLQAMVGKKVVLRTDDGMFYKEDLPNMTVWTIDGIEAKNTTEMVKKDWSWTCTFRMAMKRKRLMYWKTVIC